MLFERQDKQCWCMCSKKIEREGIRIKESSKSAGTDV